MVTQVEYSVAGRSEGWIMLCAVCIVHEETMSADFLVKSQNQGQRFDLKITRTVFSFLDLKTDADRSPLWP
jgi:hypothetical protein